MNERVIIRPYEAWLQQQLAESQQRAAAMREEAERIIAESRASIRPRLRRVLDDCQADYDGERESGWACNQEERQ